LLAFASDFHVINCILHNDKGSHLKLPCEFIHLDSTRFHYDSKANSDEKAPTAIHIAKRYSRDQRPVLNQVVLNLICKNRSGIPVYMQAQSGNVNDI
jgi:transposase